MATTETQHDSDQAGVWTRSDGHHALLQRVMGEPDKEDGSKSAEGGDANDVRERYHGSVRRGTVPSVASGGLHDG